MHREPGWALGTFFLVSSPPAPLASAATTAHGTLLMLFFPCCSSPPGALLGRGEHAACQLGGQLSILSPPPSGWRCAGATYLVGSNQWGAEELPRRKKGGQWSEQAGEQRARDTGDKKLLAWSLVGPPLLPLGHVLVQLSLPDRGGGGMRSCPS